jgi:hypothetical protein
MQGTTQTKAWTKPEMVRIGRIGDVNATNTTNTGQCPGGSPVGSPSCKS